MLPVVIFEPDEKTRVYLSDSVTDYSRRNGSGLSLLANTSSVEETVRWLNEEKGIMLAMLSIVTGQSECRRATVQLGRQIVRNNRDNYTLFCLHDVRDLEALLNTGLRNSSVRAWR